MFSGFFHIRKDFNKIALLGISKNILRESISALIRFLGGFIIYEVRIVDNSI
jgi:hypothetical protein